jgi:DNA topoisomerase II
MSWKKLTHIEHILKRPDSYVGSLVRETSEQWVVDTPFFKKITTKVSPALVKIFDEVLVNAIDQHSINPKKTTRIDVTFQGDLISVRNNGDGIPLSIHTETGVCLPELIFGHLLTSSNYDDSEERTTGGRNGYGAKLTNVFSSKFTVRVLHKNQKYTQKWSKNMSVCEPGVVVPAPKGGYVDVEFQPDWSRFEGGSAQLPDALKIFTKRVWDAAACCPKCHVYLNGNRIEVKSLEDYARMHFGDVPMATLGPDIIVGHSPTGSFQQISFVNGISTTQGGTHIERFVSQLVPKLATGVRPAQIKSSLFVVMRATLINPTFSSQTKNECTSKIDTVYEFKPKFIKDVLASGVGDELTAFAVAKTEKELKKTDGSKKNKISGIPKLDDANWAGTHKSHECTLIVTEGDSAKTLAVAGLSVVGRNAYGVFPLRGKPRNVRDASVKQLTENQEFSDLKKILGLQHSRVYTSLKELRYGRLMIMTDADLDGSHIKGLVLNMIHHFWPSLIDLGFVVAMVTPVIKAGKDWFFTEESYKASGATGQVKYYKGLGTSTSAEAKEYFKMIDRLTVKFIPDVRTGESMTLAFSKAMADARKNWLSQHMEKTPKGIEYGNIKSLTITDFIHKDLANFSVEDIKRSIPHVADGLKPSQRKVIYACLKRNLTKDAKVAQLSGYVAEHTAYHHGEASLQGTIIGLAQNFVGSNNINLLEPSGQFGTRLMGGKDAASPRYIFTRLAEKTKTLFDERDSPILKYVTEDGQNVEPVYYLPIIPMVLVNGSEGIGTGFSSYVPPYDPKVITKNIQLTLHGKPMIEMKPWFRGFTGTVEKTAEHTWLLSGTFEREGSRVHVTELPPGKWIQDYKEFLDDLEVRYENHSTETKADFYIWTELNDAKSLGLVKTIHTSNMYLIGPNGTVKKYSSPEEILVDYIELRLSLYKERKRYILSELRKQVQSETLRAKFIMDVANEKLVIFKRSRADIEEDMNRRGFPLELLVSVRTYQYTSEEIQKSLATIKKLNEDISILEATTVSNIWKQDLESL